MYIRACVPNSQELARPHNAERYRFVPKTFCQYRASDLTGKRTVLSACWGMSESGHRSCRSGAVYDRSEHIAEAREISSFECAVCGKTIEN